MVSDADPVGITIGYKVVHGERPDLEAIPSDAPKEIVDNMIACWDGKRENRPSFQGKKIYVILSDADQPAIAVCFKVVAGERPDLEAIPSDVPKEIMDNMIVCWDGKMENRPSLQGMMRKI